MPGLTAVIVTSGEVDLLPCLATIQADEVKVVRGVAGVWERWEAAMSAKHEIVYTQDDDCVVDFGAVVAQYEPGFVACNMPVWKRREYPDAIALVGWGAIFDRALVGEAFARYFQRFPCDALFQREADRVFTGLSDLKLIEASFSHLPHAHGRDRLGAQPQHLACLSAIRQRIREVRHGD